MRIIELFLDPEALEGGVDAISLVDRPAHESNFLTFSTQDPSIPDTEFTFIGEMFEMEEQVGIAKSINQLGTPTGILEMMGWEIESMEPVTSLEDELKLFEGQITAEPNQPSMADLPNRRVRYKYIKNPSAEGASIIPTSRDFCREMIRYDRVFRIEDIRKMTADCANDQFGCYDIFTWRGSYNCRHLWMKVVYRPSGPITGRQRPLEEGTPSWNQPSTKVQQNAILIEEEFGILAMVDGQPLFSSKEDALKLAEILGCEGYHEHKVGDYVGYMACETMEFESYNDYPEAASEAACKVLGWIEKYGRDEVEGMERTGLARANQLCNKEPISVDTIARMASFARHRKNSEIAPEFEGTPWKDKGYVAWEGWGSTEGIEWAQRKLEQIKNDMGLEDACWPGYEAIGLKGDGTPNCVPKDEMCSSCGGGVSVSGVPLSFEDGPVSFDYHDTLNTERGKTLARDLISKGVEVYVISAAQNKEDLTRLTDELGIPRDHVFAMGSNSEKIRKVIDLGTTHYDNNKDVIDTLGEQGVQFSLVVVSKPYVDQTGAPTGETFSSYGFSYDDEKMEITGAAIIPNKMIVRRNPITEELYYVFFSQETTKILSERFMENKYTDQTNLNHSETAAPGTFVTESWLVDDPKVDKSYALGLDYPKGTWVVTMKVKNRNFWEEIKQGRYRGYSIEGYFNERVIFT